MKDAEDVECLDEAVERRRPYRCERCGRQPAWWARGSVDRAVRVYTQSAERSFKGGLYIVLRLRDATTTMSFSLWLSWLLLGLLLVTPAARGQTGAPLRYYIREEQPANTYVGNIVVDTGLTLGPMLQLELQAGPGGIGHRYFKLNGTTGILTTSAQVDRERLCTGVTQACVLKLTVLQHSPFFHIIKVEVALRDVNDHAPRFPDERIARTISETTKPDTTFSIPVADDPDSGINGVQGYELVSETQKFALQFSNISGTILHLNLVLQEPLDREEEPSYTLVVTAKDGGSPVRTGSMIIEISVGDSNDNSPRFDNNTYEVTVAENVPEHKKILQVHAFDPDSGRNGDIVYGFGTDTQTNFGYLFEINAISGGLFIRGEVDYERGSVYHLIVTAKDLGENSLPAYAKVIVHVKDINDHAPHITINSLDSRELGSGESAFIKEDLAAGTFVAHVSVTDPDDGQNGVVSCHMESEFFGMRQLNTEGHEYQITSRVVFDREHQAEYHLELTCSDHGRPTLSAHKDIWVKIMDINDHEPQFEQPVISISMEENNRAHDVIIKVNATDTDAGRNAAVKYSLVHREDEEFIKVDPITGEIRSKVSFDFEKRNRYEFVLVAVDQGLPTHTATTTLILNIIDINDEKPIFSKPSYSFKIFENMPAHMKVGVMTATDADDPPFNDIVYSLSPGSEGLDVLAVNADTGELTTTKVLDREKKETYGLTLIASNRGHSRVSTSVNVSVLVIDQNDNAPFFVFPTDWNNTVHVPDGIAIGEVITRVVARDIDSGANSQLIYSIVKGNESFAIESHSGVVKVIDHLQCLNLHICKLIVMVKDTGTPRRKAIAELSVIPKSAAAFGHSLKAMFFLSGTNLTIIIAATVVSILLITLITVIFCRRRRRRCSRNKDREVKSIGMSETPDSEFSIKSQKNGKLPNGCCDGVTAKPKKEVKFDMDNRGLGESSTDDLSISWPSKLNTAVLGFHNAYYAGTASCAFDPRSQSSTVRTSCTAAGSHMGSETKLPAMAPWMPRHGAVNPQMATPPLKRSSPIAPLTEMEIEMAEVLQMLSRGEHDSETGSITDSGRGPSEEGDNNRPSPLDPHLNDDQKGLRAEGRKVGDNHSSDLLRSKSSELFASFKKPSDGVSSKAGPRYMVSKRQCQGAHIPPPPPPPTLSGYAGIMKHKPTPAHPPMPPIPQQDLIHSGISSFKPSPHGNQSNWPSHHDYELSTDSNLSGASSGPMNKFRYQGKRTGNDTRKAGSGADLPYSTPLSNFSSNQRTSPSRDSNAVTETNLDAVTGHKIDPNGNKDKRTVNFNLGNLSSGRCNNNDRPVEDSPSQGQNGAHRPSSLVNRSAKPGGHYGQAVPTLRVYDSSPSSRRPPTLEVPLVSPAGQCEGYQGHFRGQGSQGRGWGRDSNDGLSDDSTTTSGSYVLNNEETQRDGSRRSPRPGQHFVV